MISLLAKVFLSLVASVVLQPKFIKSLTIQGHRLLGLFSHDSGKVQISDSLFLSSKWVVGDGILREYSKSKTWVNAIVWMFLVS